MNDDTRQERYESVSAEWVNALRRYVTAKAEGQTLDFEVTYSAEYTDPPAHLLRGDGRNSVGYTIRVKGGKLEVFDGARPDEADFGSTATYDPFALAYKLPLEEYTTVWMTETRPAAEAAGKMKWYGDRAAIAPLRPIIAMIGFYSNYTLRDA